MICQLYLITPPRLDPVAFKTDLINALDGGAVAAVQLRIKAEDGGPPDREEVRRAAEILMPVVQERDVAFIINDDVELAAEIGADGVHIGQKDMSLVEARIIMGKDAMIGMTCHASRHLAMDAAEAGADYVAFGAFFPSTTKKSKHHPEPEILEIWSNTTNVPCVAIGGITHDNCAALIRSGANFIAVVSAVWDYKDGAGEAVRRFQDILQANQVESPEQD